jgi:HlyD family secretion protein
MKKSLLVLLFVLAAAAVAVGGYYRYGRSVEPPKVTTLPVSRGDIAETVGATGTLEAVTTVQVGTQVSGTIKALYADFNSIVRKGQVVAELDPSLFETQVAQGRANLVRAQADVQRLRVALEDARNKLKRTKDLAARNLVPAMELETAETTVGSQEAQLRSAEAQVVQAQASLNQSQVNLDHTIIYAPIDGIVISRNVDVGQTVAASMQAPTLFLVAADLTKMRVIADIDESDVGRIRPGQIAKFRVDAHPLEEFTGTVSQIRLQPKVVQNVVTYATVIDVPNPQLKLKPGMTPTVTIEIARKADVLRVPVAALRFRPSNDVFAAFDQEPPQDWQQGGRRGSGGTAAGPGAAGTPASGPGGGSPSPAASTPAGGAAPVPMAAAQAPSTGAPGASRQTAGRAGGAGPAASAAASVQPAAPGQGAGPQAGVSQGERRGPGGGPGGPGGGWANMDPEERRKRMQERMASMSPEEREQFVQRMRERGIDPQAPQGGAAAAGGRGPGSRGPAAAEGASRAAVGPRPVSAAAAQTIDSLFGPLPVTETAGRAWVFINNQLKPVRLRLGISDGTYTEIISGELEEGAEVVTGVTLAAQSAASTPGRSPLMGPSRGPGGGPPPSGGAARQPGR